METVMCAVCGQAPGFVQAGVQRQCSKCANAQVWRVDQGIRDSIDPSVLRLRPRVFFVAGGLPGAEACRFRDSAKAIEVAGDLISLGVDPQSPELDALWAVFLPQDYGFWLSRGLGMIYTSSAVYAPENTDTASVFIGAARASNIPVFESLDQLAEFLAPCPSVREAVGVQR